MTGRNRSTKNSTWTEGDVYVESGCAMCHFTVNGIVSPHVKEDPARGKFSATISTESQHGLAALTTQGSRTLPGQPCARRRFLAPAEIFFSW